MKNLRSATQYWPQVLALLALAFLLAWVSSAFTALDGSLSFFGVLLLAVGLLWGCWQLLKDEGSPKWLGWLLVGAALFRLLLGVAWFVGLPAGGYDTPVQEAGYVMEDAYNRDQAAWALAQSEQPLSDAFRGFNASDQYGGLLFLSAAVYRSLGGAQHQPLQMVVLSSTFSALAVLFLWAFACRAWGERTAALAAWALALYPEAALLGSSQMREAFSVALVPAALLGLQRLRLERNWKNALLLVVPVLLAVPLSMPFSLLLAGTLLLAALALDDWRLLRQRQVWLPLVGAAVIGGVLALFTVDFSQLWIVQSASWQAFVSRNASDWVTRQFERMPLWSHFPFLVVYGIFRPLLPSAVVAGGPQIWHAIAIWRALGWTVLVALIFYATYMAFRNRTWFKLPGALLTANWAVLLAASYRGGGDLWDNPRYRSAFAAVQVGLAAWAWLQREEQRDPWLRRALVGGVCMVAWFIPWYLRRYSAFDWPVVELQHVVGLGLLSAALYTIWDWVGA